MEASKFVLSDALKLELRWPREVPFVKGWNRLEGRPRSVDFERALRAEVRDALWFLTRQWQFGELRGEDAASPVDVRTFVEASSLTRYAGAGGPPTPYAPDVPLEARVEGEVVPADLTLHIQVTRYFFALLASQPRLSTIRGLYLDSGAYGLTAAAVAGAADDDSEQMLSLALPQLVDGRKLVDEIAGGAHDGRVDAFAGLTAAERADLKQAGVELVQWYRQLYRVPAAPGDDAWVPRFLEYQFACETRGPHSPRTVLVSNRYGQGHLDWWAFDVDMSEAPAISPPDDPEPGVPADEHALSFLPTPVSFSGMPSPRYWEFESRKTEFAAVDANTTDVAKLLLVEFALVYGNDWCVIPYEVDVGSLCSLPGLVVTDDFGGTTLVRAAGRGRGDDWQRWSMFTLATTQREQTADVRLFVPPALPKSAEGDTIEQVLFLRDEMANMVWAVEKIVPSASGKGADAYQVARDAAAVPPVPPRHPTPASARYVLGTDVPANWHPFLPVHVPGSDRSIQLQRARMPTVRALFGEVLRVAAPYYVNEEEVPRAGKIVERSFQRARWTGGKTFVWLGRRVLTGRGEGSSGLAFDQVEELRDSTAGPG
jgi:hypothetical protein